MYEKEARIIVDALQAQSPGKASVNSDGSSTFISYPVQVEGVPLGINIRLGGALGTGIVAQVRRHEDRPSWEGGFQFTDDLDEEGAQRMATRMVNWLSAQRR